MKLVSIVTINLNNREGLSRTIESVMAQTFKDFEFIIIDGGSSDGSIDTIRKYSDDIHFWSSESDKGIYDAMNKGIEKSSGEYILFLNSGDYLVNSQVLGTVNSCIEGDKEIDIWHGNVLMVDQVNPVGFFKTNDVDVSYLYHKMVYHQAIFSRRNVFTRYGNFDTRYRVCGDYEWILRNFLNRSVRYQHIGLTIAGFQIGGVSMTQQALRQQETENAKKKYFSLTSRLMMEALRRTGLLRLFWYRDRTWINKLIYASSIKKWKKMGLA